MEALSARIQKRLRSLSLLLKLPTSPHYPSPSTFIQLPCVKRSGLRQGSLASNTIIFVGIHTVQITHTLSAVKTEGLLPPPAPFPPSPPTALCPEIQNPRRRRNHNSSLFIIHYSFSASRIIPRQAHLFSSLV